MGGGSGGGSSTQTVYTKSEPWAGVQPYLKEMYEQASGLAGTPVQGYPGQNWVPMSPLMREGIESNIGYVNNYFPRLYKQGILSLGELQNSMNVGSNPYVQGMNQSLAEQTMAAGNQQIGSGAMNLARQLQAQQSAYDDMLGNSVEAFKQQVLPGITNSAVDVGGLGGTRQALAQIGAVDQFGDDLSRSLRDISQSQGQNYQDYAWGLGNAITGNQQALAQGIAQQNMGAYGQGLNAVQGALGMYPEMANLGLLPGQVYQQAGDIFEGYQQAAIDDAIAKWEYAQNEPWNRMANASSIYAGAAPYRSQSQTQTTPQASNPWATALAGGMGLYSMFG